MSHGPEHHLEHAEHAVHAAGDDFNRMVTMSIAIVAAVLACVTMLGHAAHNGTLLLQGDALRLQGEALQLQSHATRESANAGKQWQYYGTKNLFSLESEITLDQMSVLAVNPERADALKKMVAKYQGNVDKYKKKLPDEEAKGHEIEKKAADYIEQSNEKIRDYQEKMKESHLMHEKGTRFDFGELGLQFGVVLCSLAILTRSRGFWFAGLLSSAIGAVVAASGQFGLFMGGHH
jgi:Domain of unknown function (DUF4337)